MAAVRAGLAAAAGARGKGCEGCGAGLESTGRELRLNTERQLNVKAATVHEKVNKANSPLLHFELIDRGNNLVHHSP